MSLFQLLTAFAKHIMHPTIVADDIIKLCMKYYAVSNEYLLLINSRNTVYNNAAKLLDLTDKKIYDIKGFEPSYLYCNGRILIKNFKLSKWMINPCNQLQLNTSYNAIVTISGYFKEPDNFWREQHLDTGRTRQCSLLILDDQNYHNKNTWQFHKIQLPRYPTVISSCSVAYDRKHNSILVIGGCEKESNNPVNTVRKFQLSEYYTGNNGWNIFENKMVCKREGCCSVNINSEQLIILGGVGKCQGKNDVKCMELFDINDENKSVLTDLNYIRYKAGCVYNAYMDNIIIGGGTILNFIEGYHTINQYKGNKISDYDTCSKIVEIYNVNKNKCIVYNKRTQYNHCWNPYMWINECNPNIVYIAGNSGYCCIGSDINSKIEWNDMRENTKQWNLLFKESIFELYHFKSCSHNAHYKEYCYINSLMKDWYQTRALFII
eukprot:419748_1